MNIIQKAISVNTASALRDGQEWSIIAEHKNTAATPTEDLAV